MTKNWRPEPWGKRSPCEYGSMMNDQDYERAKDCVNAMAGVDDPQAFVERVRKIETHRDDLLREVGSDERM
jgi:hypothetical protein